MDSTRGDSQMPNKKRKVANTSDLVKLAQELIDNPREKANNLPILIPYLDCTSHQCTVPLIQNIKIYFVDCFARDELQSSTQPPSANNQSAQRSPQHIYTAWLQRHFRSCIARFLSILSSSSEPRLQVAAFAALMEFTRGKKIGIFDNELFARIVIHIVTKPRISSEVIGALVQKYANYADIRYHLLRIIIKLCENGPPSHEKYDTDNIDGDNDAASTQQNNMKKQGSSYSSAVSTDDFARNLFDVLSGLPPPPSSSVPSSAPVADLGSESAPQHDVPANHSWCGALEAGIVLPACDDGLTSRQRKKQKNSHGDVVDSASTARRPTGPASMSTTAAKWASDKMRRKAYSDAWTSFFRSVDLPGDVYHHCLSVLHDVVIPHLFNPLMLSDFLTHSLDKGGFAGMLALHGIFILVTQHGLEYPRFYERLYGLLTPDAFLSRHRRRFFQLADIFLASRLVPAYTCAAFAKRFGRLALQAPPSGALVCIAFIHNILRRHAACVQLVHRAALPGRPADVDKDDDDRNHVADKRKIVGGRNSSNAALASVWHGIDVFDPDEPDPSKARALESSLWELTALRHHSDPLVANYCNILQKNLTDKKRTAEVDITDVVSESYASMFKREAERKLKSVSCAFYETAPRELLLDVGEEGDGGLHGGLVGWKA